MRALNDEPTFTMRGDPYVERDFIWIGDVVDIFLKSLSWTSRSETINVCTGAPVTLMSLAELILRIAKKSKSVIVDSEFAPAAVRARPSSADRLREAFAFTPLETGLAQTIDWYRSALAHA
jgi:nucleoside-diphosphate-sugar epimerase